MNSILKKMLFNKSGNFLCLVKRLNIFSLIFLFTMPGNSMIPYPSENTFEHGKLNYEISDSKKDIKTPAGISRVWVIDDGEKIKQDDINNPLATSSLNPVWNGKKISPFGAKNEIITFQIILQADG